MNKTKKIIALLLCMVLVCAGSVFATVAYLTAQKTVTNTFTVGNIDITLEETKVSPDGKPVDPADKTEVGNKYHLIPGSTYTKDPTMTIKAESEPSYVRMLVTMTCVNELDAIFAPDGIALDKIFNDYAAANWELVKTEKDTTANMITYEFRYRADDGKNIVETDGANDLELVSLFKSFTVPEDLTVEELATLQENFVIAVTGQAIQSANFEADTANNLTAEDVAWAAFGEQNK